MYKQNFRIELQQLPLPERPFGLGEPVFQPLTPGPGDQFVNSVGKADLRLVAENLPAPGQVGDNSHGYPPPGTSR